MDRTPAYGVARVIDLIGNGRDGAFGKVDVVGIVVGRRPPFDSRQQTLDGCARGRRTAKIHSGHVTPGEGDRLVVDGHAQPVAVRPGGSFQKVDRPRRVELHPG